VDGEPGKTAGGIDVDKPRQKEKVPLRMKFCGFLGTILLLGLLIVPVFTLGYEINEEFSIGGILPGQEQPLVKTLGSES
jgi:hypothetical protein